MRISQVSVLVVLLVFAAACEKENNNPQIPDGVRSFEGVDQELWPYLTQYEDEAAERGVEVNLSARDIRGSIIEIPDQHVAGTCQYDPDRPNQLRIDRETWDAVGQTMREYIVFHELGHCERLRKHREEADSTGACVSIMASGVGECFSVFRSSTRERLLDELFDPAFYGDWE